MKNRNAYMKRNDMDILSEIVSKYGKDEVISCTNESVSADEDEIFEERPSADWPSNINGRLMSDDNVFEDIPFSVDLDKSGRRIRVRGVLGDAEVEFSMPDPASRKNLHTHIFVCALENGLISFEKTAGRKTDIIIDSADGGRAPMWLSDRKPLGIKKHYSASADEWPSELAGAALAIDDQRIVNISGVKAGLHQIGDKISVVAAFDNKIFRPMMFSMEAPKDEFDVDAFYSEIETHLMMCASERTGVMVPIKVIFRSADGKNLPEWLENPDSRGINEAYQPSYVRKETSTLPQDIIDKLPVYMKNDVDFIIPISEIPEIMRISLTAHDDKLHGYFTKDSGSVKMSEIKGNVYPSTEAQWIDLTYDINLGRLGKFTEHKYIYCGIGANDGVMYVDMWFILSAITDIISDKWKQIAPRMGVEVWSHTDSSTGEVSQSVDNPWIHIDTVYRCKSLPKWAASYNKKYSFR